MNFAIKVENLEKSYGSNKVLKGISFSVIPGEIFALLGVNGAGKTTTLECIEGLRKYDSGSIDIRGKYGVQLQSSSLPHNIKAKEALTLFAKWQHTEVNNDYINRFGIQSFINKKYSELSTGQKRRLHLGLALLGEPDIVFLDEPTAGLDVEGRAEIHAEIQNLKSQGKTIILASHDMSEVEDLCDKIAILKDGEIAFLGTQAELTKTAQSLFTLKISFSKLPDFENFYLQYEITEDRGYYSFKTTSLEKTISEIISYCKSQNILMTDIKVERAGIEERFLQISREGS